MRGDQFNPYMMQRKKGPNFIFILVYLVFGLYFVNYPFNIVTIPTSWSTAQPWIIFAGGILILLGAVNYFRAGSS